MKKRQKLIVIGGSLFVITATSAAKEIKITPDGSDKATKGLIQSTFEDHEKRIMWLEEQVAKLLKQEPGLPNPQPTTLTFDYTNIGIDTFTLQDDGSIQHLCGGGQNHQRKLFAQNALIGDEWIVRISINAPSANDGFHQGLSIRPNEGENTEFVSFGINRYHSGSAYVGTKSGHVYDTPGSYTNRYVLFEVQRKNNTLRISVDGQEIISSLILDWPSTVPLNLYIGGKDHLTPWKCNARFKLHQVAHFDQFRFPGELSIQPLEHP